MSFLWTVFRFPWTVYVYDSLASSWTNNSCKQSENVGFFHHKSWTANEKTWTRVHHITVTRKHRDFAKCTHAKLTAAFAIITTASWPANVTSGSIFIMCLILVNGSLLTRSTFSFSADSCVSFSLLISWLSASVCPAIFLSGAWLCSMFESKHSIWQMLSAVNFNKLKPSTNRK